MSYFKFVFLLFIPVFSINVYSAGGTIKGTVTDAGTKQKLAAANVLVLNTTTGTASDIDGNFTIENIPAGTYTIRFSYLGYETITHTDIVVRPDRITFLDVELKAAGIEMESVEVKSGYFTEGKDAPAVTSFSYEEIRRAPGSAGDVSRILMSLPSVAKVNDQSNSLIVRGGSPTENSFYIDNIEVPNINHFPLQGSSGGPIGMINVDFVKDLKFYSGGFSSVYGNKLSSVMEINFREGNREEIDGQLDLNFSGFGAVAEGPLFSKGSWMISARRSYLDLLVKAIDIGTSIAPRYADYQWKAVYNLNPSHKISFIGLIGNDYSFSNEETARENKMEVYGEQNIVEATTGLNWQAIWGSSGYSNTSVSYSTVSFDEDYFKPVHRNKLLDNSSSEKSIRLRNINHYSISSESSIEFGADSKLLISRYNNYYGESRDVLGNIMHASTFNFDLNAFSTGAFVNYTTDLFKNFSANIGIRTDYLDYNNSVSIDPRLMLRYKLNDISSVYFSTGIYHQPLPNILLAQNSRNKNLENPMSVHYTIGFEQMLTEDTRLTLEIYDKEYSNFPLDPEQPGLFIIDENIYSSIFYSYHNNLIDAGKAYSRGIELIIQKKLARNFYGLASASYFRTRYSSTGGTWENRIFDNRFTFSFEGGYKPGAEWEFSARWIYAGGVPYTPFDKQASGAANMGVLDGSRINKSRYPDYHSLNIRVDKRFLFETTNLIVYLSVWNAYNRENVANYFWNTFINDQDEITQWTLLPIFGVEYEF